VTTGWKIWGDPHVTHVIYRASQGFRLPPEFAATGALPSARSELRHWHADCLPEINKKTTERAGDRNASDSG
jgi:hypothetical protein